MKTTFKKRLVSVMLLLFVLPMMTLQTHSVYATQSTITAPDITINQDDTFTALQGVKSVDSTGVETTAKMTVSGVVDTHKPGTYTVTYTVVDSTGDKTEKTRKVTVVAKQQIAKVRVLVTTSPEYKPEEAISAGTTLAFIDQTTGKEVTRITSTNQVATIDLPYGKYTIKPIQFPKGMGIVTVPNVSELVVDKQNTEYIFVVRQLVSSIYIDAHIEVEPYALGGVVYEFRDLKGNLITTLTSSKSRTEVTLPDGKYTVSVVKIPKGYKLSSKSQTTITVVGEGKRNNVYQFNFEKDTTQNPTNSKGSLPQTNGEKVAQQNNTTDWTGAVFGTVIVLLIAAVVVVRKKVK